MPTTAQHHADQLRACAALGGQVEILEPGCDSPSTVHAAALLADRARWPVAAHRAQQSLLGASAVTDGINPDRVTRLAGELVELVAAVIGQQLAQIESRGGSVHYRSRT